MMVSWRKFWMMTVLAVFLWSGFGADAFAAPKKKNRPAPKDTITYVVQKGDSVDKIAKKYDVRGDDIARWNNLSDVSRIKIGQKLRIRVPKGSVVASAGDSKGGKGAAATTTITQSVSYVVKKGDNLGKIARKTGVSVEELKKNNAFLRKNPDKLRVGQTIILKIQRFDGATGVSRGLANNGSLSGGIQLKDGPGYIVRNAKRSYGTALTVGLIMDTMAAYAARFPKAPRFGIGDLSVEKGGKLAPHLSHQSGRDVDISFIHKSNKETPGFTRMNGTTLDIEKNWFVLDHFLKTKKVQYIFIDYDLQKYFYDYAKSHGYSDKELFGMIQYPNGKKSYNAIIRHSKGHADHFHVRFVCAATDKDCH
ncbi:MAG: penicillin-insensitive murein endopeptidase [Proteobacteria bacterium]|nr:penicillin-insensitive murein endopeptidase [Pseudomonadota bacterium]